MASARSLEGQDAAAYRLWEIDQDKLRGVIKVGIAALIYYPQQLVLRGAQVPPHPIDLAEYQGGFITPVIDANGKWLGLLFHVAST